MATIEARTDKNGKVSYRVKIRRKGCPAISRTFTRKTDAKNWANDQETALRQSLDFPYLKAQQRTLSELIDSYLRDVVPQKKSWAKQQIGELEFWRRELGAYQLSTIDHLKIEVSREVLRTTPGPRKARKSEATINRSLAALSAVFSHGIKLKWIAENPCSKVQKLREPKGRTRFLSDSERTRLLNACKQNEALYLAVVLSLSTGARKQEIMSLRWAQIDFNRGTATLLTTKNEEVRVLPLIGVALDLLKSHYDQSENDLVFPGKDGSKPIDLRSSWEKALKMAEIDDFRWHDLRHSAASYLAMNGASVLEIADILGHKTLQMVKRYAHLSEQHSHSVVADMNKKIFG